jgi:hypothetical protein
MVDMTLADLLKETIDLPEQEVWENKRTPTPVRVFGVQLHPMGLSVREVAAVLDLLGTDRSHGAVWHWTHDLAETQSDPPTAEPWRSLLTRSKSKSMRWSNGSMQPSIPSQMSACG